MALFHARSNLTDGTGVFRAAGSEFDVSVDGGNTPVFADDRANVASGRMYLVTGGPGPTPTASFTPLVYDTVNGGLARSDTKAPVDPGSVVPHATGSQFGTVKAGVAGGAALLNGDGAVVDAAGLPVVSEADLPALVGADGVFMADAFARADGGLAGSLADTGQTWSVNGAGGGTAAVASGRFVSTGVSYATPGQLADQPIAIAGKLSAVAGTTGGDGNAMAMMLSSDSAVTLQNMLHLVFSYTGARLTWWKPGDQDNEMAQGTSNLVFAAPLAADGTVHQVVMAVTGDHVRVEFSNGEFMEASDPNVSDCAGRLPIWEILSGTSSLKRYRWESVWAIAPRVAGVRLPTIAPAPAPLPVLNISTIGFVNSWAAASDDIPVVYKLDGVAYIEGRVTGGAYNTDVFTLPAGYRPPFLRRFYGPTILYGGYNYNTWVDVAADGKVHISNAGAAPPGTVDIAISFRAA